MGSNVSVSSDAGNQALEYLLYLSIYLGVQTYPIAYAAMPFVAIISAVAAVVSLAVSGFFAINAVSVNATKDQNFEETIRSGMKISTSIVTVSVFNTNKSEPASVGKRSDDGDELGTTIDVPN